jgi:hypothetical protein
MKIMPGLAKAGIRRDRRSNRLALLTGLFVAGSYLLGAFFTGRIDPLARRPIFDGFAPPPPYQWVSPPPTVPRGNDKPATGRFRVKFGANGVSKPDVLSTSDLQVTLIVSEGTFAPKASQTSTLVTIQPFAPAQFGPPPSGLQIAGNVYRLQATYEPGDTAIPTLTQQVQLTMVYPPASDGLIHRHAVLQSPDGKSWTTLVASDAGSQVGAQVGSLGYFAVAEYVAGGKRPFPLGKIIQYVLIGAFVLVLAIPIAAHELRSRRSKRRRAARRTRRR